LQAPIFEESSFSGIKLSWASPSNDGGCPITGYYLLRDDLESNVVSIEVPEVTRNIATLRETSVALSHLGLSYTFQLFVVNREGASASAPVTYLFAAEPQAPSLAPAIIAFNSTSC